MKIDDFTNEGFGDWLKKAGSAAAGWAQKVYDPATRAFAAGEKQAEQDANLLLKQFVIPEWSKFLYSQPGYQNLTPDQLKTLLVNWANERWSGKVHTTKVAEPTIQNVKDARGMYAYLLQRAKEYLGATPSMAPSPSPAPAPSPVPALAKDVQIINLEPAIIRYQKTDYSLDDTGAWHAVGNKKPVTQAWQAFFNKQHDIALGIDSAPPVTESATLVEGGNAIPSAEPVAEEDVPNVVALAKKYMPRALQSLVQTDIGSAGYKVESGDIDLMIDTVEVVKFFKTESAKDPILAAKHALQAYFVNQGIESNIKGRNVHIGVKYRTRAENKLKVAQVDVMIINEAALVAPWHQHGLRGQYKDPEFQGNELFIVINSLAKHLNLKFDAFSAKLMNRDTNEVIARTRPEVAKILLGPRAKESDLDSVKSILRALENDPDKESKLAQARQDAAKGLIKLPEVAPPGTAAWFNDRVNRLL